MPRWPVKEPTIPRVYPSAEEAKQFVSEHQEAVQRLHPDLKAAYDAWQRSGHQGSIYDYLPGNYRQLLK